jgi:hypothetical protein
MSKAELILFLTGNWFLTALTDSVYCLQQMLLSVCADGNPKSLHNTVLERCSSRVKIVIHGAWAGTQPNMRLRFQVSWWNLAVWKSFAVCSELFVSPFSKCTQNLYIKYEFPLRIYNQNTSTSFALEYGQSCFTNRWTSQFSYFWLGELVLLCDVHYASQCLPIELVPCSDG